MRLGGSRRLLVVMLATTFVWPVPATATDPPTPTAAPSATIDPTPESTSPPVPRSEAPTASPPSSPAPSSAGPTPSDPEPPAPPNPAPDRTAEPAAPNQEALDAAESNSGFSTLSCTGAIIDNGFIQLGVNREGHLNVPCGIPSSETGTTYVGLRYLPDNTEATAPGCLCEGWGVADATSGVTGYANVAVDGVVNLVEQDFSSTGSTATSVVEVGTTFRVTHRYVVSPIDELYEVFIQVENISSQTVDLRYRRVMDWDIEPTAFDEFVTIEQGSSDAVAYTSNDGFATANPLGGPTDLGAVGNFTDVGPDDHGALFDFDFGELPSGQTKSFFTYYGAAATESEAHAALAAVGAEAYSLGQPNTPDGPTLGTPNTFIFAFKGLTEVEPVPEDSDLNGHPNSGLSKDPVHTFSGSFVHAEQDLAIPGRGPAIALTRTYNSNDSRVGPLGLGWTHNYAMRLADAGDGSGDLVLVAPQGRSDRYTRQTDGTFTPPDAIHTQLVQEADGTYTATQKDRSAWRFDAGGRLTAIVDRHGNTSALTYDAAGNLTAISDPAGRGSLALAYTDGRLTSVSDWLSPARVVTYGYDTAERLATVIDRTGAVTTYAYDGTTHWLTSVSDANGHVQVTNTYDPAGRVIRQQDARGLVSGAETTFAYTDNPDGTRTTLVSYPPAAFAPSFAPTQQHVHNADGWLLSETLTASATESYITSYTYDAIGNRGSVTDARGATTSFCFDVDIAGAAIAGSRGNLTRRIDPPPSAGADALVSLIKYDADDNVERLVPPRGVTNAAGVSCGTDLSAAVDTDFATDLAYDTSGAELRSVSQRATDPESGLVTSVTTFEYGDAANPGLVTLVIPPRGNTGASPDYGYATTYTYGSGSQAGMLVSVADPLGNTTSFGYDAVGRRSSVVDANGNVAGADPAEHTTTYSYDAEDRARFIRLPAPESGGDALVTEFRYDAVGKRTVHIDAAGQVIRYGFDERNDLERVEHSPSAWTDATLPPVEVIATTYTYDDAMSLTRITRAAGDAAERATDYAHDGLGRLRSETQYPAWPSMAGPLVSGFSYDANGNLAARTDPLGQTASFAYDALNRLTGVDYADVGTADVSFAYDANGNRTSMADGTGTTGYAYDELDRLLNVIDPSAVNVGYRYDPDGNRSRLIYPGAGDLDYAYDAAGRLISLTDWDARVTEYAYGPDGNLAGTDHLNGTTTNFAYDKAQRLASILHASAGSEPLARLMYSLDSTGNVAEIAESNGDPITERISIASTGEQSNGYSEYVSISDDGRYVAFSSAASNLVPGDTNTTNDIFVHDRAAGLTTRVSVDSTGAQANGSSFNTDISSDGRYVAFYSNATNLVPADTNGRADIFVHDRQTATTSRVSVSSEGTEGTGASYGPSISSNGRYVAFYSVAGNLVFGDTNGKVDSFVHDRQSGATTRISVASDGSEGNAGSSGGSVSNDGRYVTFSSSATNLVAGDTNGVGDIFVRDREAATTTRVSVASDGTQAMSFGSSSPAISGDGRVVAWHSKAGNLVAGDTNNATDVFVHDRETATTRRVSVASDGTQGTGSSSQAALSSDGRYVAFDSGSRQLVTGDTNGKFDVFRHDRATAKTIRVSIATNGSQANASSTSVAGPDVSADGHVAFDMPASNLVSGDTNGVEDVFVRGAPLELTTYSHDRLSRLTGVDGSNGVRSYAYDPVGNRLEITRDGSATAYAYDAADRLTSVGGSAVTVDAAGNLIARGSDAYSYDAANRLVSATMNGVTETATYDGDGTRVATTVGSTTTSYVHDLAAGLPLVIDDGTRRYVWGPAGLAYSVETASGELEVVHADHLGSVRTSTDATGAVTATARYDEFGVPLDATGASDSPFGFTGEPTDPTGLVHLRARSYDPSLGRFLNRDPWRGVATVPGSLNRYCYVQNNPVRYTDPSGLRPEEGPDLFDPCVLFGLNATAAGAGAAAGAWAGPPGVLAGALVNVTVSGIGLGAALQDRDAMGGSLDLIGVAAGPWEVVPQFASTIQRFGLIGLIWQGGECLFAN